MARRNLRQEYLRRKFHRKLVKHSASPFRKSPPHDCSKRFYK